MFHSLWRVRFFSILPYAGDSLFDTLKFMMHRVFEILVLNEPRHEKICLRCFRPGKTQTGLRSHRS